MFVNKEHVWRKRVGLVCSSQDDLSYFLCLFRSLYGDTDFTFFSSATNSNNIIKSIEHTMSTKLIDFDGLTKSRPLASLFRPRPASSD